LRARGPVEQPLVLAALAIGALVRFAFAERRTVNLIQLQGYRARPGGGPLRRLASLAPIS